MSPEVKTTAVVLPSRHLTIPPVADGESTPLTFSTFTMSVPPERSANYAGKYLRSLSFVGFIDTVYSDAKEQQGDAFPKNLNFSYGGSTSNSSLRPHLEKAHWDLYMRLKEMHGWDTQLPGEASRARSQATGTVEDGRGRIEAFSEETFHKYLYRFIVADDQVCASLFSFNYVLIYVLYFAGIERRRVPGVQKPSFVDMQ